jgi:hypothetical protein
MPQITKGETFADGELVTGLRLNNIIDLATLNAVAITAQTAVASFDIESTDTLLVYDSSANALRKATIDDIFRSGQTIIATQISGKAGVSLTFVSGTGYPIYLNSPTVLVSDASIGGNATITGTATITGITTFNSSIVFNGSTITGNATINGNVVIGTGKTLTLDSAPTSSLHAATKGYVDSSGSIKAFAKFAGATGTYSGAKNISSVTKVTTGTYNVVFTTPMANTDYIINSNCTNNGASSGWVTIYNQTTTGFQIYTAYPVTFGGAQLPYDPTAVFFTVVSN